ADRDDVSVVNEQIALDDLTAGGLQETARPQDEIAVRHAFAPAAWRRSAVAASSTVRSSPMTTPYCSAAFCRLTNPSMTSSSTRCGSRSKGLPYPPPPPVTLARVVPAGRG